MFRWQKKFVRIKLIELCLSAMIVYIIFFLLAVINTDFDSINPQPIKQATFFKLHQPKTVLVQQPKKSVPKHQERQESKKAIIPQDNVVNTVEKTTDIPNEVSETSLEMTDLPSDLSQVDDATPVVLKSIRPRYPEVAKKAGVEANILLELIINEKGHVIFAHVIFCSQAGYGFEESAKRAAKKLSFKPFTKEGQATKVKLVYPINFKLI